MRKITYFALALIFCGTLFGQNPRIVVTAQPDLAEWDIIYASDIDKSYGESSPLLFGYRLALENGQYPVEDLTLRLKMTATVSLLQLENEELFSAEATFDLLAPIYITNKQLDPDIANRGFTDEAGNEIKFDYYSFDHISSEKFDQLQQKVYSNLQMPDGNYVFDISIECEGYEIEYRGFEPHKDIHIATPANIELTYPLNESQLENNPYPVFTWSSTGCENYSIRICEYDPMLHSSPEDAILSDASFPFPDDGGFAPVGSSTELDYLSANGRPLELGKSYAWQVMKICKTTGSDDEFKSEIYTFTVTESGQATLSPCQQQLRTVLGDSQYNALFGTNGPLEGFGECAEITLDGETLNTTEFSALLIQLMSGALEIESITTQ